jgi:hypothetical protein
MRSADYSSASFNVFTDFFFEIVDELAEMVLSDHPFLYPGPECNTTDSEQVHNVFAGKKVLPV